MRLKVGGGYMRYVLNMADEANVVLAHVSQYISINVFNSGVWDELPHESKVKAIFNSYRVLVNLLPDIYGVNGDDRIDTDDLVNEIMWLIRRDDSVERAEQGATMITLDGMTLAFNMSDGARLICPFIQRKYNLSATGQVRRVGRYSVRREDTHRTGMDRGNSRFRTGSHRR